MKKSVLVNAVLAALLGLSCLITVLVKVFSPAAVLPKLDVAMLAFFSLAALAVENYLSPKAQRAWVPNLLLAGASFALLPWCAGLAGAEEMGLLFLLGMVVFGVSAFLYGSMARRMASGPAGKAAPALSAFVLFLAAQSLGGLPL